MVAHEVLRSNDAARGALDQTHPCRSWKPQPMTIIPDGLLVTNAGHFGELCRGQTLLPEVIVEAHDGMVTEPDTRVNEMLGDTKGTFPRLYRDR